MIKHVHGDRSGVIHIQNNHVVHIALQQKRSRAPVNLIIESSGTCILPSVFVIVATVHTKGALYGLEKVVVDGELLLYRTGYSACRNCSMGSEERGHYWMDILTVRRTGTLNIVYSGVRNLNNGTTRLVLSERLDVDYGGTVLVKDGLVIYAQDVKVEKSGEIRGDGSGYGSSSGPGAGFYGGGGTGAGHGGRGGGSNSYTQGGAVYGQQCLPTDVGSGGGNCNHGYAGGSGGGAIQLISSRLLVMEGQMHVHGLPYRVAGGGGGSGGSLWMDGLFVEGWGLLFADGGAATSHSYSIRYQTYHHYGGGGAGGRLRTFSPSEPHAVVIGRRRVAGGSASTRSGEAGTLCVSGQLCSGHGIWLNAVESCECEDGYVGNNCQIPCNADITCNAQGTCTQFGGCECFPGYVGYRCEHQCDRNTTCSGNGECTPHGDCVCDLCHHGSDCSLMCSGNGICSTGICKCDSCYIGEYCHSMCNHHGICSANGTCDCEESWRGDFCTVAGCPGKYEDCSGHGICNTAVHQCYCEPGWKGSDCSLPDCPGEPNCFDRGICNVTLLPPQCQNCSKGWMGADCNETCLHGNQIPMDSGICVCDPCWSAKGCNIECTGHGFCSADNATCECDPLEGWRGEVCEIPGCPGFGEDCTGHGDCNSAIHKCTCFPGWTGVGCHIPDCPGDPDCFERGFCNATLDTPVCQNCSLGWMGPACDDPCVHGVQMPMDSGYCNCSAGWSGVGCDSECSEHGVIVDNACICDYATGWKGELCDIPGCPGKFNLDCSGRGDCDSSLHKCVCNEGWSDLGCGIPDCPGNPDCANRGHCNETFDPPLCTNCSKGWMGPACEDPCVHGEQIPMDSGFCNCTRGWAGVGCDAECSLHGKIINEVCVCDSAWTGDLCDVPSCPGLFNLPCSGRGECNSATHECTCNNGWTGEGCELPDCPGMPDCFERGYCNETYDPPRCTNCIQGWMGADCNEPCVRGIQQPMDSGICICNPCYSGKGCDSECTGHGQCQHDTCVCDPGWHEDVCQRPGCPGVSLDCTGHGDCNSALHICFCFPGWTGDGCDSPDCPGEPDCSGRGFCNTTDRDTPVCTDCIYGWMGPECNDPCTHGIQVPKDSGFCECEPCWTGAGCNSECSGNGVCDETGQHCLCFNDENEAFLGDKCETLGCPGLDGSCNQHGTCNAVTQDCTCYPGWAGADCSIADCPGIPSCSGKTLKTKFDRCNFWWDVHSWIIAE